MNDEKAIVNVDERVRLGALQLAGPQEVIIKATAIASELAKIVDDRHLFSNIRQKKYVRVEGWNTMGAMIGVLPRELETHRLDDGSYESTVELIRVSDGAVIGRGSAICGMDESTWGSRDEYARRSMAITRATGKAFRLGFSWIMALAGYEPTPLEEMDGVVEGEVREVSKPQRTKPRPPKPPNGNRPYSPASVRDKIRSKAATHSTFEPSDKQQALLRHALELCFAGDKEAEDKRHTLLFYLTGHESTKNIDGQTFKAIIEDWLDVDKDSGGEYTINDFARKEAQAIVTEALKDEGQKEMPL